MKKFSFTDNEREISNDVEKVRQRYSNTDISSNFEKLNNKIKKL